MKIKNVDPDETPQANLRGSGFSSPWPLSGLVRTSLFLELADCVEDLIFVLDPALRIIAANRQATSFFGYSEHELAMKYLTSLVEAGERRRIKELFRKLNKRRSWEALFLTRTYRKMRIRFSLSPVAETGDKTRGYLLVGRGTDEAGTSLISDQLYGLTERILEGLPEPVFITDCASRTVTECNESAVSVSGYERQEILGQRLFDHVSSYEKHKSFDALLMRAEEAYAKTGLFKERVLLPRKNRLPLPCDCISLPAFGSEGLPIYYLTMFFDRSPVEEHEAVLTDLAERLKNLSQELTASASSFPEYKKAKRLSTLGFTARQIEIARLVVQGASSKDIGFRLGITESTVKNHLSAMFRRIGASSRLEFMRTLIDQHIRIS